MTMKNAPKPKLNAWIAKAALCSTCLTVPFLAAPAAAQNIGIANCEMLAQTGWTAATGTNSVIFTVDGATTGNKILDAYADCAGDNADGPDITVTSTTQTTVNGDFEAPALGATSRGALSGIARNGGNVTTTNNGTIISSGHGLAARSLGGSAGGDGGNVAATNNGQINLSDESGEGSAMFLTSIGGSGENGISVSGGTYTVGDSGGPGGRGGSATAVNSVNARIITGLDNQNAITALSVGGGGGSGGNAFSRGAYNAIAVGGSGGNGGSGGAVSVTNAGRIHAYTSHSLGIKAMSIGGGGGHGGTADATAASLIGGAFAMSTGGSGGLGGNGDSVTVNQTSTASIVTGTTASTCVPGDFLSYACMHSGPPGDMSTGILAQSIGGGGGNGGQAITSAGTSLIGASITVTHGGSGNSGGNGDTVQVNNAGSVTTGGRAAAGILAQSIGGGGGNGGTSFSNIDQSALVSLAVSVGFGGSGAQGGQSGNVTVDNRGSITTYGTNSAGLIAQSLAGGGGHGGSIVDATTVDAPLALTVGVNLGGKGGSAGTSGGAAIFLNTGSSIATYGDNSAAMVAQSIGGGGGSGGSVHTYSRNTGGGKLYTNSLEEDSGSIAVNATVGIGGSAAGGGNAGTVVAQVSNLLATYGVMSPGVLLQSIGGGGGHGGHVMAYDSSVTIDDPTELKSIKNMAITANVGVGGTGGTGGTGNSILLALYGGSVTTTGSHSSSVVAQAIGGGGGAGGSVHTTSVTTSIPTSPADLATRRGVLPPGSGVSAGGNLQTSVAVGGSGGSAGSVTSEINVKLGGTQITTQGHMAHGLLAQSIGGGGGIGGSTHADGLIGVGTYNVSVNVSGKGGGGGTASQIDIGRNGSSSDGSLFGARTQFTTRGDLGYAILAQSIGGGGGHGGTSHVDFDKAPHSLSKTSVTAEIGGSGGGGATGGDVHVSGVTAQTTGLGSHAIFVQSIGGGGGSGGATIGGTSQSVNIGGGGAAGGNGGTLSIYDAGATTNGNVAAGIFAQSIGGGGGHFGIASVGKLQQAAQDIDASLQIAHSGSDAAGGDVKIGCVDQQNLCAVNSSTSGTTSFGIFAQSIGGGGGVTQVSDVTTRSLAVTMTMEAPGHGTSGKVTIKDLDNQKFAITTAGNGSHGIVAQSIDSGGGVLLLDQALSALNFIAGTSQVTSAGNGGVAIDLGGTVQTSGNHAAGILAQSLTGANVVFRSDGHTTYGGSTTNNSSNWINLRRGSSITTTGKNSHGLTLETFSSLAAAAPAGITDYNPPATFDTTARAALLTLDGAINISGNSSWGVIALNGNDDGMASADQVSTYLRLGKYGTITATEGASGISLRDSKSAVIEIVGLNDPSTASYGTSIDAAGSVAINADAKFLTLTTRPTAIIEGDVNLGFSTSGSNISLNHAGMISGAVNLKSNGGRIDADVTGQIQNLGKTAISFDTTNASIAVQSVLGDIIGTEFDESTTDNPATLQIGSLLSGSVIGNIAYQLQPNASVSHVLSISGNGGQSDHIRVNTFDVTMGSMYMLPQLTSLPTPSWRPATLIEVGNPDNSWTSAANFGLFANTLVTNYNYSYTNYNADYARVTLDGVDIDFSKAGLDSSYGSAVQIANGQIQSIQSGKETPDPTSELYKQLLESTQYRWIGYLQQSMQWIETNLHSTAIENAAQQAGTPVNDLQSCGGDVMASVNPVAQGECNWARVTYTDASRDRGTHQSDTINFSAGHQKSLTDKLFLGIAAAYQSNEFSGSNSFGSGNRVSFGGVLKYVSGNSFGSISMLGSYGLSRMERHLLPSAASQPLTARSERENWVVNTRLRAGQLFDLGVIDAMPMVDVDVTVVRDYGYTETGAGSFNLQVGSSANALIDVHPSIQFGRHFTIGDLNLRAHGSIGKRFALNDASSSSRLINGIDPNFVANVVHDRENEQITYGFGLILDISQTLEGRLSYDVADGETDQSENFSAKLTFKF